MNIQYILDNSFFKTLPEKFEQLYIELEKNSKNIFTLSNSGSHLELFHSDIMKELLCWKNESDMPTNLELFIDYLNVFHLTNSINKKNYRNSVVLRENKNIDILIKDIESKHCIIIENKINNAGDQENQLENYYNKMNSDGFEVDAIVYLTLSGNRSAPRIHKEHFKDLIIDIEAFSNNNNDLVHGYLLKVKENSMNEIDLMSLTYQYIKLIKHLSQKGMDRELKQQFYELISSKENFNSISIASQLLNELHNYRADEFDRKLNNQFHPFKKKYRYRSHYWLYENFERNGILYKLDVSFNANGSARIDFWLPNYSEEDNEIHSSLILREINLENDFKSGGCGNGKFKIFEMSNYDSIEQLDLAFFNYVRIFLNKLNEIT